MTAPTYIARVLAKNLAISPQKARLVADLIRGLPVGEASERLQFSRQKAGKLFAKALDSAIANAEQNHNADIDALVICRAEVSDGMKLSRARFGARGRVNRITRRRSHILLELDANPPKGKKRKGSHGAKS